MQSVIYEKWSEKSNLSICTSSIIFKQDNLLFSAEQDKALKRAIYEFETWIFGSNLFKPIWS